MTGWSRAIFLWQHLIFYWHPVLKTYKMPSNTFLNDIAAGRPMELFSFLLEDINNLASFHNASGILLTVGNTWLYRLHLWTKPSQAILYLFLEWVLITIYRKVHLRIKAWSYEIYSGALLIGKSINIVSDWDAKYWEKRNLPLYLGLITKDITRLIYLRKRDSSARNAASVLNFFGH